LQLRFKRHVKLVGTAIFSGQLEHGLQSDLTRVSDDLQSLWSFAISASDRGHDPHSTLKENVGSSHCGATSGGGCFFLAGLFDMTMTMLMRTMESFSFILLRVYVFFFFA
jgi:hypothetical protein